MSAQGSEATESVRTAMEKTAGQFLAYRTALTEPSLVERSARLHASMASWLVQLLLDETPIDATRTSFAPGLSVASVMP